MELLINNKINEYNRRRRSYTYQGNEIQLYYCLNNIIYSKCQYNLLTADINVLFTLLYRKLCKYYKKELYYIYKNWWYYNIHNSDIFMLIEYKILNIEYLYIIDSKNRNRFIIPKTYYNCIYSIWGNKK